MRLLTEAELKLIAGGGSTGSETVSDYDYDIVVNGHPNPPSTGGGTGGVSGVGDPGSGGGSQSPQTDPVVDGVTVTGIDCPKELSELNRALDYLKNGSPTAVGIISEAFSSMKGFNNSINLLNNGVDFTYRNGNVDWDPYSALQLYDTNGNIVGVQTAALGLIHELTHRVNILKGSDAASDLETVRVERLVAAELNKHYGQNTETARANHGDRASTYWAQSSTTVNGYGSTHNTRPESCS